MVNSKITPLLDIRHIRIDPIFQTRHDQWAGQHADIPPFPSLNSSVINADSALYWFDLQLMYIYET